MTWLRNALYCLLLASLILVAMRAAELLRTVRGTVALLPVVTHAAIREQGELTRTAALIAIADVRRETLTEVTKTRTDLLARVDRLTEVSERSIAGLTERADLQLSAANRSLALVAGTVAAARPTLENVAAITGHASEASAVLLRRDALPAQILGVTAAAKKTLGETASTMREVRRVAPETAASVNSTAASVAGIAKSWEKQTPLYVRLLGWLGRGFVSVKALIN